MFRNIISFSSGTIVGIGITKFYPKEVNNFIENKQIEVIKEKVQNIINGKK